MTAYYNENDPYAAEWLRNLIAAKLIAPGIVDERSIVDVQPDDLKGYTQVHLFAGIGGWSYAARLAQWPDDKPLWTGSCPCQPFSAAGKQRGTADARHLWPEMHRLVAAIRPPVVVGEQVASAASLAWFDTVCTDLESAGYATGAAYLCAASVGAPHIRQRLWWVAHSLSTGLEGHSGDGDNRNQPRWFNAVTPRPTTEGVEAGRMGDADNVGSSGRGDTGGGQGLGLKGPQSTRADADGFWSNADHIPCRDGKTRPVEPFTFPLAHGVSNRVGRLRAYGNAIVPALAAEILTALLDMEKESSCYSD
jgi:DNA (cytosine-5)-methyltransferase 1